DNVVTSVFVFEGDGLIREYVGGYEDWQRQRAAAHAATETDTAPARTAPVPPRAPSAARPARVRLSFKEQRELEELPGRIERLESEVREIEGALAASEFYSRPAADVK